MFYRRFGAITFVVLSLTACGVPEDALTGAPIADRIAQASATASAEADASASASAPALPTMTPLGTVTPPQATPTLVPTDQPTTIPEATATVEMPIELTATATPDTTATPSAIAEASPTPTAATTGDDTVGDHPVALEIANELGVPVAEVEGYHDQGIGYGILAQFYSIAYGRCGTGSGYTVAQLIALKQGGMGMGEIRKQALGTAAANECSLGRIKQGDLDAADAAEGDGNGRRETPPPGKPEMPPPGKPEMPPPGKPEMPRGNGISNKPKPPVQPKPKPEQKPASNGGGNAQGGGNGKGK